MGQYDRIAFPSHPGKYTNPGMVALLKTYCAIMGHSLADLTVYQGSFNTTVQKSAGTHDKADCIDLSADNAIEKCKTVKLIGGFGWERVPPAFGYHVHMGRQFSTAMAWLATAQDKAYRDHKSNGLGDLSHTDTSWCPRYRSIKHLYGPSTNTFEAVRSTPGYTQPGGTPTHDADLIKSRRAQGFQLTNIAGTVRCNGRAYFVTTHRTFYLKDDFVKVVPV